MHYVNDFNHSMINPCDVLMDKFHTSDTVEFEIYYVFHDIFQLIKYRKIIPPCQFGGICKLTINYFIDEFHPFMGTVFVVAYSVY